MSQLNIKFETIDKAGAVGFLLGCTAGALIFTLFFFVWLWS